MMECDRGLQGALKGTVDLMECGGIQWKVGKIVRSCVA